MGPGAPPNCRRRRDWSASGSWGASRRAAGGTCGRTGARLGHDDPALALRQRPAFLDPHRVAGVVAVFLVVRGVFFRARHVLLVDRMDEPPLDAHDDGLVTGVADHGPLKNAL